MEVEVQTPGGLRRELHVTVAQERVDKAFNDQLRKIARRAKIPGFRPGKAPMKVVEKQYGAQARGEVITELLQSTYPEAVSKAGVQPAGHPQFEVTAEGGGAALQYVARIEVYPEIELKGLDKLKVEQPEVEVTDEDVSKLIESLRTSRRTLDAVDRAAQAGDVCKIDFAGTLDGEPFDGGNGKDQELEIGSGRFLADLENGVVGHSAGEEFIVDVSFPDDYQAENLQGKTAQFAVTLHSVTEPKLPAIDGEFLKAHNVDPEAGEQGLTDKCRDALGKESDKAIRSKLKSQVLDQLLEKNPIDVPEAMIEQEIPRLREEAAQRFNAMNLSAEQKEQMLPAELFKATAQRRVSLGLLIGEVIKAREIKLDDARVEKLLDETAADYEHPEQIKQYYRGNPQLMQGLHAIVMEEQVVEALLDNAKTKTVKLSLDELLNPSAPAKPASK